MFSTGLALATFLFLAFLIGLYKKWPRWLIFVVGILAVLTADVFLTEIYSNARSMRAGG